MNGGSVLLRMDKGDREVKPRVCADSVLQSTVAFWQSIHAEQEGYICLVSGFRVGSTIHGITRSFFAWPGDALQAGSWIAKQATYGRDVYHVPYLLSRPKLTSRLRARVVVADLDYASLEGLPAPTFVVQTSPARKQAYWILDESVSPRVADYLSLSVQHAVGMRPSIPNFMRVPGIPNFKYHDVSISVTQSTETSYKPGHFAAMLGLDPRNLPSLGPGVMDWISGSSRMPGRLLRGAVASASALVLTFGSLGLQGTGINTPGAAIASEGPTHIELDRSPEAFIVSTVHLGSPNIFERAGNHIASSSDVPSDVLIPENESPPPSPLSETASEEFDLVREVGQAVFEIKDDLT